MTPVNHRAASAYKSVGIQTRTANHDQHELVTLMLEAVLENIYAAQGAIAQEQLETKIRSIGKAIRIIQEGLHTSLDLENGGAIANNLANLYDYVVLRLTQANMTNDVVLLQEATNLLKPVLEAWVQIRPGQGAAKPAAPSPVEISPEKSQTGHGTTGGRQMRAISGFYGAGANLRLAGA